MDNPQTTADVIREILYKNPFLIFLVIIVAIPGFAAISTKVILTVLDLIVYGIFGRPRPQAKPKPAPPERPADEKDMIRQISVNFMARRGTSPEYAIERAEEMVDALKKKGLLR